MAVDFMFFGSVREGKGIISDIFFFCFYFKRYIFISFYRVYLLIIGMFIGKD